MQFLVPNEGKFDGLIEVLSRSGLEFISPANLRSFILETTGKTAFVASLSPKDMMIASRHSATLLHEIPSVLMNVPDLVYTPEWMTSANFFPPVDWVAVESQLRKSGTTAYTTEQMEKRHASNGLAMGPEKGTFGTSRVRSVLSSDSEEVLESSIVTGEDF